MPNESRKIGLVTQEVYRVSGELQKKESRNIDTQTAAILFAEDMVSRLVRQPECAKIVSVCTECLRYVKEHAGRSAHAHDRHDVMKYMAELDAVAGQSAASLETYIPEQAAILATHYALLAIENPEYVRTKLPSLMKGGDLK